MGSGLGLYVAKMIIDVHDGKVWAESDGPGKGSAFHFSLPIAGPKVKPEIKKSSVESNILKGAGK